MPEQPAGRVHLVGAGPGDPGLLTLRALRLIEAADVILHDRLIPPGVLDAASADAELVYVGKDSSGRRPSVAQEQIEQLMIEHARAGRNVVRLKGGDPCVFGRAGEEAMALRAAGVSFTIVPGVTSGVAAAAHAGIPVTYRGLSGAVALVTAHQVGEIGGDSPGWQALGAFPGTIVLYMGMRSLPEACAALLAAGRPPDEPAAVVENGTLPWQRSVQATLATIAAAAAEQEMQSPAVTIIGKVAGLADRLDWFAEQSRPLAGKSVVVTRARTQAGSLSERLLQLGARVIDAPSIRTVQLSVDVPRLNGFDLLCLTSPNGVAALLSALRASGRDARALAGCTIAAIGPGTARALAAAGIDADIVPERSVAEGLLERLQADRLAGQSTFRRALIARARQAREVLPEGLRAMGIAVELLDLYETLPEILAAERIPEILAADFITFTSASTVRHLLRGLGAAAETLRGQTSPRLLAIGPATSAELRAAGLQPAAEAAEHTIDGLIAALRACAGRP